MKRWLAWTLAIALLAVPAASLTALALSGDRSGTPGPSPYLDGQGNATAWRATVNSMGVSVSPILSDPVLASAADGPHTLLLLVAPDPPTARATETAEGLLARGGVVWLADPAGAWNPWLLGHGAAVGSQRLAHPGPDPSQVPLATQPDGVALATRSPATVLLRDEAAWRPWLLSPPEAALDLASDGAVNVTDPPGPHLVGAMRDVGKGILVVTADTSFLEDSMGEGNPAFTRAAIARLLPDGGAILVDESARPAEPHEGPWRAVVRAFAPATSLSGSQRAAVAAAFALLVACAAANSKPILPWRRHQAAVPEQEPFQSTSDRTRGDPR